MFGAVHLQQITPPLAFLQNNSVSFTSGNLWDCYTCRGGIYLHKYCLHFFFRHEINFCLNKPFASIISMISCSKEKCSWQERVFVTTAPLTGSWRSKTIFKRMTIFGWNLCQQITNYKLQFMKLKDVKWKIFQQHITYNPPKNSCRLCLFENFTIMSQPELPWTRGTSSTHCACTRWTSFSTRHNFHFGPEIVMGHWHIWQMPPPPPPCKNIAFFA